MNICIVSPHIDDAILSCGIRIQREIAAGNTVFILDIFSAGTNGENRQKEEERAARIIGAEPHFLNELDAPDRDARYSSVKELFLGDLRHVPISFIEKLAGRIGGFFKAHNITRAWFPLGAGTHIDHRTAFEAAQKVSGTELRFYEDRPYILWPGVLKGRMNALGIEADVREVTPAEMAATVGNYHYLTHFVPPGQHRDDTLPIYQAALAPAPGLVFKATAETLTATEPELRRMFDALAAYESQMPFIYSDYDNFVRDSMTYERHAGNAAYTERSWRLQPL